MPWQQVFPRQPWQRQQRIFEVALKNNSTVTLVTGFTSVRNINGQYIIAQEKKIIFILCKTNDFEQGFTRAIKTGFPKLGKIRVKSTIFRILLLFSQLDNLSFLFDTHRFLNKQIWLFADILHNFSKISRSKLHYSEIIILSSRYE